MFYIGFTSAPRTDEQGRRYALGEILLGDTVRQFEADLTHWSRADYEAQWRQAIARLAEHAPSSAFITSFRGPGADFHSVWPFWREGAMVHFQERLLITDDLPGPFDPARVYELVGDRRTLSDKDEQRSEWSLPLGQVMSYLIDA